MTKSLFSQAVPISKFRIAVTGVSSNMFILSLSLAVSQQYSIQLTWVETSIKAGSAPVPQHLTPET